MNHRRTTRGIALALLAMASAAQAADPLYDELLAQDRALFEAFNKRDIESAKRLFASDLEFFHDKGGLEGYAATIASLQRLFSQPGGPQRELVAGSVEVFPLPGFGAVQLGRHRFCNEGSCSVYRFTHVWRQLPEGRWQLARVISIDH